MIRTTPSGVLYSTKISHIQGIVHGFTQKKHGNMMQEEVRNHLFMDVDSSLHTVYMAPQIHDNTIVHVQKQSLETADGLFLPKSEQSMRSVISVHTADCYPILVCSTDGSFIMTLHAGWRGVLANIIQSGIDKATSYGYCLHDLVVAVGPGICVSHFCVGEDVAKKFKMHFENHHSIIVKKDTIFHINLREAILSQLQNAGISRDNIDCVVLCTYRSPDRFYSYRRDGAGKGQMLGYIGYKT